MEETICERSVGSIANEIVRRETIAPGFKLMEIRAPEIAEKIQPGQFMILRVDEEGERIPMSVADWDRERGTVTLVFQELGLSTKKLGLMEPGERLANLAGPLGKPADVGHFGTVVVVSGCFGAGPAYALARALKEEGNQVISIVEAYKGEFLFWLDRLEETSDRLIVTSGDRTVGVARWAKDPLREILASEKIDRIYLVGCTFMMATCSRVSEPFGTEARVSLMPIMIDGTGMCGACRVNVGGETKLACVEGPEFAGHEVDWNELMERARGYLKEEERALDLWEIDNWHLVRFRNREPEKKRRKRGGPRRC
ncbi:sulfide/dihydroorotate dehydrogenase-like FAD/NAD-binding protein [Methanocrinis sp.]|uniref:sulfide/dihydroorotate dehydrogenase-like FAD/NAD-binding protein n=1 Tax=Methanocrinis sp. TaxID=3101522 RepID=UPI003D0AAA2A